MAIKQISVFSKSLNYSLKGKRMYVKFYVCLSLVFTSPQLLQRHSGIAEGETKHKAHKTCGSLQESDSNYLAHISLNIALFTVY